METTDTSMLLRAYVQNNSESAFRELVRRYLDLVYATALRRVNLDSHFAEDVTQTVFSDLARKAATLPADVMLGGWLHQHTCFVASNLMRAEHRRLFRETNAAAMNTPNDDAANTWEQLAPILDDAINALDAEDRQAVLLRFFEQRDFRSIGAALGVSDNTACQRVGRALEKLRGLLVNQGVSLSVAALTAALTDQLLAAAPSHLAAKVGTSAWEGSKTAGATARFFSPAKMALVTALVVAFFIVPVVYWKMTSRSGNSSPAENGFSNSLRENVKSSLDANASVTDFAASTAETNASVSEISSFVSTNTNVLHLTIIAADSGKPVANVPVQNWCWSPKQQKQTNISDRLGLCKISLPDGVKHLQLTTRLAGFSDTRLEWWPERGETIPTNYTLKLPRGVLWSGRVLNEDKQPVPGAVVVFNCRTSMEARTSPEKHEFGWLRVETDSEGHWQTDRIGADAYRLTFAQAYHSNYVDSLDEGGRDVVQEWRDGTHVFILLNPVTARGMVVDEAGEPIEGATVAVSTQDVYSEIKTNTAPDGTFAVPGCKAAESVITVAAEGFSFSSQRVTLSKDSPPLRIILQRGSGLRLRVSNREGKPLTNAYAQTRNTSSFGDSRGSIPQERADSEGRIIFKCVPATNLWMTVSAEGYMNSDFWIQPNENEHSVILGSPLVVRGTVRDENGQPISRLRVVRGWPEISAAKTTIHWGSGNAAWMSFSGGQYEYVIDYLEAHPLLDSSHHPGHILKFEAEDHTPFISRTMATDEGEARLDVVLQRAPAVTVEIVLPNGQPAAQAKVGLGMAGTSTWNLASGTIGFSGQGNTLSADGQGRFKLPRDSTLERVIVTHDEGYAEVSPADLLAQPVIPLQPWGKIVGTYEAGGKPVAGKEFWFSWEDARQHKAAFEIGVITDAKGAFHLSKVPPGKHAVTRRIPQPGKSWEIVLVKKVEVRPGETTEVHLGNNGYTITARLRWPEGWKKEADMSINAAVFAPVPEPLLDLVTAAIAGQPEAKMKMEQSPELRATMAQASRYPFTESADGLLTATDMETSSGVAGFMIVRKSSAAGKSSLIAIATAKVIIPSDPSTGTMDLGEIELQPVPPK